MSAFEPLIILGPEAQWFSAVGNFVSSPQEQGTFSQVRGHVWLSQCWGSYWHLVGGGQRGSSTPHSAQGGTQHASAKRFLGGYGVPHTGAY